MNQIQKIEIVEKYVKKVHEHDTTGHDYQHILRVRNYALQIANQENVDTFLVEIASLLHDVIDEKLFKDKEVAWEKLTILLDKIALTSDEKNEIYHILKYISYKAGKNKGKMKSQVGLIVQDADRIDALGAIGIARTFQYAGHFNEPMHIEKAKPRNLDNLSASDYYNVPNTAINHFYEKLLLLKDQMNTDWGKKIAEERHIFMEEFLKQFFKEWRMLD